MVDFVQCIDDVLKENANVAGGAGSVLGTGVTSTATQFSGDNFARLDTRVPKVIGSKIIKRNQIPNTIFTGKVRKSRKKK